MLNSKPSNSTLCSTVRPERRAVSPFYHLVAFALCILAVTAAPAETPSVAHWRELTSPQYLWPDKGAIYYSFETTFGTRVHLVVINVKSGAWQFKPALNEAHVTTSMCAEKNGASAATNGGYFNLSDGTSASHIVVDGKLVANPTANKALMENPRLKPFINAILNRSEVRFLENRDFHILIQIAQHNAPLPPGYYLTGSLQAGPRLLPKITSEDEAFVRTEPDGKPFDGIRSMKGAARTAFGITPDGYAMMLCAAGAKQDPESHGLTLPELANLLRDLGCSEAINLDGGSSTTMFVRLSTGTDASAKAPPKGEVVCGKEPETMVRSALLLKHRDK